jgi:ataxin-10
MREHAIFTLHNLLEDNQENQAVVDAVQSERQWDENGVLQNTPRAVY